MGEGRSVGFILGVGVSLGSESIAWASKKEWEELLVWRLGLVHQRWSAIPPCFFGLPWVPYIRTTGLSVSDRLDIELVQLLNKNNYVPLNLPNLC